MAVEHMHHTAEDRDVGSSALLAIVLLIAVLAIGAFAIFAYNGNLNAPAGTGTTPDVNIEGQITVPNPGATVPGTGTQGTNP